MLYNVKAGIIGLEKLGRQFAHLVNDHVKNLNLIAGCGRTQEELLFAKNDLSLEYVYSDEKSLFENHDIDVIIVCSEAHLRPHQAIQAIEAGKHVFVLSPIALNVEDAKAVFKAADSKPSQRVVASSKVKFMPLFQLLKETIDRKSIGNIRHISVDSEFIKSLNKKLNKPTGSLFLDNVLDEIELCLWLLDKPFNTVNVKINGDTIICQAESKYNTTLDLIIQSKFKKKESYLSIYGDKGHITVSNKDERSFSLIDNNCVKTEISISNDQQFVFAEYLQLHNFVNVIMGKEKHSHNLMDIVDSMELALAFEKSKVLGETVDL